MSSIDLGRTLRKLLAAFRTFQLQFSPDGNRNQCTHAAALSNPSWYATNTVVDVHPRASTERMRGDTDLRFCTYTCTELPSVQLCRHFATYYNPPPKKKISSGIKWSAHVHRKHDEKYVLRRFSKRLLYMTVEVFYEISYSLLLLFTKDTVLSGRYLHKLRRNMLPPNLWSVPSFKVSGCLYQTTLQSL